MEADKVVIYALIFFGVAAVILAILRIIASFTVTPKDDETIDSSISIVSAIVNKLKGK